MERFALVHAGARAWRRWAGAGAVAVAVWAPSVAALGQVTPRPSAAATPPPAAVVAAPQGPEVSGAAPVDAARPRPGSTKIREGSMLRRQRGMPPVAAAATQWRSVQERWRDAAVQTHVERVAWLDAIAEIATTQQDGALLEAVEDARRQEMQRYYQVMRQVRRYGRVRFDAAAAVVELAAPAVMGPMHREALQRARRGLTLDGARERLAELVQARGPDETPPWASAVGTTGDELQ